MIAKPKSLMQGVRFASIAATTATLSLFSKKIGKRYLLSTLGGMPGLTAKAAQLLATKLDLDPSQVHQQTEPLNLEYVKEYIDKESPLLYESIETIDPQPHVASLGQVHKAELTDGSIVAIKIQYPNVAEELDAQLDFLLQSADFGPQKKYGLNMTLYHQYFKESFKKEVHYLEEAKSQTRYRSNMKTIDGIIIPRVIHDYTTDKILTQSYEHGVSLKTAATFWPEDARRDCSRVIATSFLYSLFAQGYIQCDPHPGNWAFRTARGKANKENHEVIQYDFGSMLEISQEHRSILIQLINAYRKNEDISPFDYLVALEFDPMKLSYIADRIPVLISRLLDPFLTPRAYAMTDWDLANVFESILGVDKWWFRTAGPPWFLMLMRAVQGVKHLLTVLATPVPLGKIYEDILIATDVSKVEIPSQCHFTEGKVYKIKDCAEHLYVEVMDNDTQSQVVFLTMPARSVDYLEEIVPADVLEKIRHHHDLTKIKKDAQRNGYRPKDLFLANTDKRSYKVWLK